MRLDFMRNIKEGGGVRNKTIREMGGLWPNVYF